MKYTPSVLGVGQLSGKGGSVVASHNRYGSYLRNRTIPTNPNTTSQQGVRGVFGGIAQAWRTLSQSQRDSWSNLSPNVPIPDSQGNPIVLAGNALYAKVNMLRDAVGDARIDDAPALDSPPTVTGLVISLDSVGPSIDFQPGTVIVGGAATNNLIVRASAPRSPGRDYVGRSELKQIDVLPGNQSFAAPVVVTPEYEAVFGAGWLAQVGMEIVLELMPVSENGLPGVPVRMQGVIT